MATVFMKGATGARAVIPSRKAVTAQDPGRPVEGTLLGHDAHSLPAEGHQHRCPGSCATMAEVESEHPEYLPVAPGIVVNSKE